MQSILPATVYLRVCLVHCQPAWGNIDIMCMKDGAELIFLSIQCMSGGITDFGVVPPKINTKNIALALMYILVLFHSVK